MTKDYLLSQLNAEGYYRNHLSLTKKGREHVATCFMHEDNHPSLSVNLDKGLWHCPVCDVGGDVITLHMKKYFVDFKTAINEIAEEQGITMEKPKLVASYAYTNRDGHHLYEKQRYEPGINGGKKSYCFKSVAGLERMHDPVFYNLPAIINSKWVIIVEGEKCADKLIEWGLPATTLDSGSSSKWYPEYTKLLSDKQVVILPDNDPPGKEYAERLTTHLQKVKIVELDVPLKGDIVDWSGDKQELLQLIKDSPLWEPTRPWSSVKSLIQPTYHDMLFVDPASRGVLTGFETIDSRGGCFRRGDLIVIAARPSMGKTALAISIMLNMAKQGNPSMFFSLETSVQQVTERLLCQVKDVSLNDVNTRKNHEYNIKQLTQASIELAEYPIYLDDTTSLSIESMSDRIALAVKELGIKCVFVDYIQLMNTTTKTHDNDAAFLSYIAKNLKKMAKDNDLPIVALAQVNRACVSRPNKRPAMADIKGSSGIEDAADVIAMLYRDEYYSPTSDDAGKAELIFVKWKTASTGIDKIAFLPESMRFANLSQWTEQD